MCAGLKLRMARDPVLGTLLIRQVCMCICVAKDWNFRASFRLVLLINLILSYSIEFFL